MNLRSTFWLAAAAALMLSGCSWFGHKGGGGSTADPLSSEAAQLLKIDQAFATAVDADLPGIWDRFLDAKATRLTADEPLEGVEAIKASMQAGPKNLLSWQPHYAEVFDPGDVGWTWGEWQLHEPGAGGRRLGHGKYVTIWKKQEDGSWKARLDMGGAQH